MVSRQCWESGKLWCQITRGWWGQHHWSWCSTARGSGIKSPQMRSKVWCGWWWYGYGCSYHWRHLAHAGCGKFLFSSQRRSFLFSFFFSWCPSRSFHFGVHLWTDLPKRACVMRAVHTIVRRPGAVNFQVAADFMAWLNDDDRPTHIILIYLLVYTCLLARLGVRFQSTTTKERKKEIPLLPFNRWEQKLQQFTWRGAAIERRERDRRWWCVRLLLCWMGKWAGRARFGGYSEKQKEVTENVVEINEIEKRVRQPFSPNRSSNEAGMWRTKRN